MKNASTVSADSPIIETHCPFFRASMLKRIVLYTALLLVFALAFPMLGVASLPSIKVCPGVDINSSGANGLENATIMVTSVDDIYNGFENVKDSDDFILASYNLQITSPNSSGGVDHITNNFGKIVLLFAVPSEYTKARLYYCDQSGCKHSDWLDVNDGYLLYDLTSIQDVGPYANLLLAVKGAERGLVVKRQSALENLSSYVGLLSKSEYSESNWDWIDVYAASGDKNIRIAPTEEAVDAALALAKTNIAAVPKMAISSVAGSNTEPKSEAGSSSGSDDESDNKGTKQGTLSKTPEKKTSSPSNPTSPSAPSSTVIPVAEDLGDLDDIPLAEEVAEEDPSPVDAIIEETPLDEAASSSDDDSSQKGWLDLAFLQDWRFLSILLGLIIAFMLAEFAIYIIQRHKFVSMHKQRVAVPVASEVPEIQPTDYKMGQLAYLMTK